jgi:hypothetical protein
MYSTFYVTSQPRSVYKEEQLVDCGGGGGGGGRFILTTWEFMNMYYTT